ncbi:MAG: M42 family peptidase [Oscillospiraceae bacterium]
MLSMLRKLLSLPAVSGTESDAYGPLRDFLCPLGKVSITPLGSILCTLKNDNDENLPHIMLEAHLDKIGMLVSKIDDNGFLKISPCGGVDIRATAGNRVMVHTESCDILGIICSVPPMCDGKKSPLKVNELAVDVGLTKAEAAKRISLGDRIFMYGEPLMLQNDNICSPALDNRAGCAAVISAGKLLKGFKDAKITLALCSQEEVGGNGAKTATNILNPDYAIAVDVSFASTPAESKNDCGSLNGGTMIGFAPTLSKDFSNKLVYTAKIEKIPYQKEIMSGRTGTDADSIVSSGKGVKTALLSIPLRCMHTPNKIVNLTDIESTAKLMAAVVRGGLC